MTLSIDSAAWLLLTSWNNTRHYSWSVFCLCGKRAVTPAEQTEAQSESDALIKSYTPFSAKEKQSPSTRGRLEETHAEKITTRELDTQTTTEPPPTKRVTFLMRARKCVGLHWKAVATFTLFRRFTPFLSFLLLFSCVQKLISVITTFNLQLWLMWDVLQNSDASWKCPQSCWAHRPSTGEDLKRPPHHSSVPRGCQRSRPGATGRQHNILLVGWGREYPQCNVLTSSGSFPFLLEISGGTHKRWFTQKTTERSYIGHIKN